MDQGLLFIEMSTAEPCFACGTTGGRVLPHKHKPLRCRGHQYGQNGMLCSSCFDKARYRWRRTNGAVRPTILPHDGPTPPCELCGTTVGFCHRDDIPARYDASMYDIVGLVCFECIRDLQDEAFEQEFKQVIPVRSVEVRLARDTDIGLPINVPGLAILTPSFTLDDLSPRAFSAYLRRRHRRAKRRARVLKLAQSQEAAAPVELAEAV